MSIQFADNQIPFIDLGDGYTIRLEYDELTDEKYIEKAKLELRETPENVQLAIEELRALIKGKESSCVALCVQIQNNRTDTKFTQPNVIASFAEVGRPSAH
jgi:hypothetical protein